MFDLYRKETDRNMYLLPSSCHSPTCQDNIPFSLALRIVRICSFPETREFRFQELKSFLSDRGYRSGMIDAALAKARAIPRIKALKLVIKPKQSRRPVFVVSWDPRLPSINALQEKHWRAMVVLDPYLKDVFPEPPLVAYRRVTNIGDKCITAKLPEPNQVRNKRHLNGMKRCGKMCVICPFIKEGKQMRSKKCV